jgi:hypothetical protein
MIFKRGDIVIITNNKIGSFTFDNINIGDKCEVLDENSHISMVRIMSMETGKIGIVRKELLMSIEMYRACKINQLLK